jgi:TonB family protein
VLEASGKLKVVRVVRGLGHGLDESAIRAAEQINFKPALRDGQPADSTAVLHIIFQLA